MVKWKVFFIKNFLIAILFFKLLIVNDKIIEKIDFTNFVRNDLHRIYEPETKTLLIMQVIALICLYVICYYGFFKDFSLGIERFKNLIKFNSKGIIDFYIKGILFFGKILFIDTISLISLPILYMFFSKDYNYDGYVGGILDLLKLSLLLILVLLLGVVFPFKRIAVLVMVYVVIISYIFFFKSLPYSYIGYMYCCCILATLVNLKRKIDI